MNRALYDKIIENLKNNYALNVTIRPALKCVEAQLNDYQGLDEKFLLGKFEDWFYDYNDYLTEYALANSYDFEFTLKNKDLICEVSFVETNDTWYGPNEMQNLTDIFIGDTKKILLQNLGIPEVDFNESLFDAEISYEDFSFKGMHFYYDDQEITLSENDSIIIKRELESLISKWSLGHSLADNKTVTLERYSGSFLVEALIQYSTIITPENE